MILLNSMLRVFIKFFLTQERNTLSLKLSKTALSSVIKVTGRKVEFPVSEIVKDRAKSQVPFLYVQGIWLYPLPNLWRIGQIS